jgi:nucleoside-diphosphate-sugar epimerase
MRLLILGGNKFLGKELVRQALQQNHELTIISLDSPEFPNEVDWINVNRNNYDDLRFALEGKEFDCIIDNIAYRISNIRVIEKFTRCPAIGPIRDRRFAQLNGKSS